MALALSLSYPSSKTLTSIASPEQLRINVKCLCRINSILHESRQFFIDSEKLDVLLLDVLLQVADDETEESINPNMTSAIKQSAHNAMADNVFVVQIC